MARRRSATTSPTSSGSRTATANLPSETLAYPGRGRFVVQPIDLSGLVEENAHLLRSSVARTVTVHLRLDRDLPPIEADAGQVQQVITNLMTNASEAIGDRAGAIVVATGSEECDAQRLERSRAGAPAAPGRFVYLEVADSGGGMDEATQQRLFDPFFSTQGAGRGLGMSAFLGIVRGHRGAVFVDSAVGRGTTIRALFPALEPDRADARSGALLVAETCELTPSGKVLVADDEEGVREVCREMVEALGFEVIVARDGREAVDLFRRHADAVSYVLLDLSMPNLDGLAAYHEISRIKPGVRVVLSSGYNEQESLGRLSAEGPVAFVQKPYTLRSLREAMAGRRGRESDEE